MLRSEFSNASSDVGFHDGRDGNFSVNQDQNLANEKEISYQTIFSIWSIQTVGYRYVHNNVTVSK